MDQCKVRKGRLMTNREEKCRARWRMVRKIGTSRAEQGRAGNRTR